MNFNVIKTPDIHPALYGLGFNKGVTSDMNYSDFYQNDSLVVKMIAVADKLSKLSPEHKKFLRQIEVIIQINAPRYFWSEFDTYKVGTTAQSESTMHTILKTNLTRSNFQTETFDEVDCAQQFINRVERIKEYIGLTDVDKLITIKRILPESFKQMRLVTMNYEVLANIIRQRKSHRLPEWKDFCSRIADMIPMSHWIIN